MKLRQRLFFIAAITLVAVFISLPETVPIRFKSKMVSIDRRWRRPPLSLTLFGKNFYRDFSIKQGLDLQGGTHVLLVADMSQMPNEDKEEALRGIREVISRRVDLYGVSEPVIQTSVVGEEYRLIVELPGIQNVDEALNLIGTTAQLDFRELVVSSDEAEASNGAEQSEFKSVGLTGKDLKKSRVEFDPNTGKPVVALEFSNEGAVLFGEVTERNVGKPLAIFLDNQPVTIPVVNEKITGGRAVISGEFTTTAAKNLSIQLNAGALPVEVDIVEQRNVVASLGQDSVSKSLRAGLVGLTMVVAFMVLYYGWSGFLADMALLVYGVLTLALYKLIPITLTLPGLAGFILSVGMAVDSNILIFERMKEELREGKPWREAMELGFGRAWDSIKDANIATLITAIILFNPLQWNFLNTSGQIRGFALTLSLGIGVSLFTGIVVTRTLMRAFYRGGGVK